MTINALTREDILQKAPAVLSTTTAENVSKQYVHVPTVELIEDMEKLGWQVVDVKQGTGRKHKRAEHRKHMVIFRNENIVMKSEDGEVVYPQILLTNSHDGLSAFQFRAGLFRLVCSNGLVVSTKDFGSLRILHKGYSFDTLKKVVMELVEQLPITVETLNRFREVILSDEQKVEFALKALGIRFGERGMEVAPEEILKPVREEDAGNDLWAVFNVIQEKMTRGGSNYKANTGRNKTARTIKNFTRDMQVNEQLYALAESYVN